MERDTVLDVVARSLMERRASHPLRVGIDGACGAGKTVFRHALAERLRALACPVLEVDSDGFHHVQAIRRRQGRMSARGYYEDAYAFDALERHVLRPLGRPNPGSITVKVHDLATDRVVLESTRVDDLAVVLFDCTFLQRGELRRSWDEVIHLHVAEDVALARGVARDAAALGGRDAAIAAYEQRYLAACRIYEAEERPRERASILIDNTDPALPVLLRC